ncbi:26S proteasome non-ATPase regulatory subunit protein A [Trifolium repens]|nr:26S proteasome non-ATPase regulatory subunit protein A [Trifolium repens]
MSANPTTVMTSGSSLASLATGKSSIYTNKDAKQKTPKDKSSSTHIDSNLKCGKSQRISKRLILSSFSFPTCLMVELMVVVVHISEGGALYAFGVIHANHGVGIKQFLCDSLCSTTTIVQV